MGMIHLVAFTAALLVALVLTRAVRDLALRRGWTPKLSAHHIHRQPVPRLGGVAVFIAIILVGGLAKLAFVWLDLPTGAVPRVMRPLLLPSVLIFALGLYDDLKPLSARVKFS